VTDTIDVDDTVDARALMCPVPVLAATKAMRLFEPGQVLQILATDNGALSDIPAWAEDNGHDLRSSTTDGATFIFYVRKAVDQ
jgi:tRNA 2-thiouridine synthesizing protein A